MYRLERSMNDKRGNMICFGLKIKLDVSVKYEW